MGDVLANRLRKRRKQLARWARRNGVTCFRLYQRDIPEHPCIVDWYAGEAVVWCYHRTRDETPELTTAWQETVVAEVAAGLEIERDRIFLKRRGRQRGRDQYQRLDEAGAVRVVHEQGLRFEVNLSDYLDTGLFLDHRQTRAMVRDLAEGLDVLNCFAYTGSFSCYAAAGGARTTLSLDLSKTYGAWTRRNLALGGWDDERHRTEAVDVLRYLAEVPTQRFGLIVCDPPTFSNSKRMARDWSVERDHPWLLWRLFDHLAPGGVAIFSTNCRGFELAGGGLPPLTVREITADTIPPDFERARPHRCWLLTRS